MQIKRLLLIGSLLTTNSSMALAQEKPEEKPQVKTQRKTQLKPLTFSEYAGAVKAVKISDHLITLADFKKVADKPDTCILDLRSESEYKSGHIKGSKLLGADIDEAKLKELIPSKSSKVILYCANTLYPSRRISLNYSCLPQVLTLGYKNTLILDEVWHSDGNVGKSFMDGPYWVKGDSSLK